jgi:uncharacterized protein
MSKTIGGIFGRNPYGPLHEFAIKVHECASRLPALIDAWRRGDRPAMHGVAAEIDRLEGEADEIKTEIRGSLSRSIFSSIAGSRIQDVVQAAERVADNARAAARLVEVRETLLPDDLGRDMSALAEHAVRSMALMAATLEKVRAAADRADHAAAAQALAALDELSRIQEKAVDLYEALLKSLFRREKEIDPVSVIFLMRIIEGVAGLTRSAENAGEALRRLGAE